MRSARARPDEVVEELLVDMSLLDVVPDVPALELGEVVEPLVVVLGVVVVVVVVLLLDGDVVVVPDVLPLMPVPELVLLLGVVLVVVLVLGAVLVLLLGVVLVEPVVEPAPVAPVPDVPEVDPELPERVSDEPLEVELEPCDALVP